MIKASSAAERRTTPRRQTSFVAELASGTVLVPVTVQDVSSAGCGVVIMSGDPDLPEKLGGRGLLHLPVADLGSLGTILPVTLRNVRSDAKQVVYGLEFGPLLADQSRKLQGVLEVVSETD